MYLLNERLNTPVHEFRVEAHTGTAPIKPVKKYPNIGWEEAIWSNSKAPEWPVLAVEACYLWYWKIKLSD